MILLDVETGTRMEEGSATPASTRSMMLKERQHCIEWRVSVGSCNAVRWTYIVRCSVVQCSAIKAVFH